MLIFLQNHAASICLALSILWGPLACRRILIPTSIEFHFGSWLCSVIFPINIHALLNLAVSEILLVLVGLAASAVGVLYTSIEGLIHEKVYAENQF